jgi:hypothetical protein
MESTQPATPARATAWMRPLAVNGLGQRLRQALIQPFTGIDQCPARHPIDGVTLVCPKCGRFVLFLPGIFRGSHRYRSRIHGMIILVAAVISFVLFRYTDMVWPLYWFLLLGIVHTYATVFTRGAALGSAAWFLATTTVVSGVWAVARGHLHPSGTVGVLISATLRLVPFVAWLLVTAYMFTLGRRSISKIKTASSYFLGAATLTLGFWGIWLYYLENGLVTPTVYAVAVAVGLAMPALCILLLFILPVGENWDRRPWWLSLGALTLVALATNLILVEPLVEVLGFILGQFFPRLVGVSPLYEITTDWLGGQYWRAVVSSAMLLVAATLVVVRATQEAARREAGDIDESTSGPIDGQDDGSTVPSNEKSAALTMADDALTGVVIDARYLGEIALLVLANIYDTLRRAFFAVLPSVAFSLLSMLTIIVLGKLGEYLRHGPFLSGIALWGMVVTVLVSVIVLCGIAFDFSPSQEQATSPQPRLGVPFVLIASGTVLTSLAYFLVSFASGALLPILWPPNVEPVTLFSGDVYFVNLAISIATLVLLACLFAISEVVERRRQAAAARKPVPVEPQAAAAQPRPSRLASRVFGIPAAAVLVTVAGASVYFGAAPTLSAVDFVTGPYSAADSQALTNRLPAQLAAACGRDYLLVQGQTASAACRDGDGTEVSYHTFDTAAELDRWYRETSRMRGVPAGTGSCDGQWPAEQAYTGSVGSGRVACYVDRRGAWLLWTDNGMLGIALRSDGRWSALYSAWAAGTFSLRPR